MNLKSIIDRINKEKRILISISMVLLFVLILTTVLSNRYRFYPKYENNSSFSLNDIVWNVKDKKTSRTSYITPFTASCREKVVNKNELATLIKYSNYSELLSNEFEHSVVYDGTALHSIRSVWQLEDGVVTMLIDPNNSPDFLFDNQSIVETIDEYDVVAQKSNFNNDIYEIDIGIKKSGVGVWIFGGSKNAVQIEKLVNFILDTDIEHIVF